MFCTFIFAVLKLIDPVNFLVLEWVIVDRRLNYLRSLYVTSLPGQLSLDILLWVSAISTSESWDVNRRTARCICSVSVVWQCKLVFG